MGGVFPRSLRARGGDFVSDGGCSVFAGGSGGHDGCRRLSKRDVGEGTEIGRTNKVGGDVVTTRVVAKAVVGGSCPDGGASFGTRPRVAGGVWDSVATAQPREFGCFVGADTITLSWGSHCERIGRGAKSIGS